MRNNNTVGIVQPCTFSCCEPPGELPLDVGTKLGPIELTYEAYGELNPEKSNAILIMHALSGDAHAAGYHTDDPAEKPGWWENAIGPGKAFDTNRYFVICSNVIGGCRGSTGPSSINPDTGKPFGLQFPMITIRDMVRAQKQLIDHLGIPKLLSLAGGSMGGMQVLQWAISYPERIRTAIPIATSAKLSAQAIALDEVGRQAILSDPNWNQGDYYGKPQPEKGLALARMIGHITYLSEMTFDKKFGRRLQDKDGFHYDFLPEFQVESYLKYKGNKFVERFDANSYLYITRAIDYFDVAEGVESLQEAFANSQARFLILSFSSDWLFPAHQSMEIVKSLRANRIPVSYSNIESPYGHDAFLLPNKRMDFLISHFLSNALKDAQA